MRYSHQLKSGLKERLDDDNFAEILATPDQLDSDEEINWYTEHDDIACINELSESEQHELLDKLYAKMRILHDLLEKTGEANSDFFDVLRLALHIPHRDYIYRVHGKPVIVAWGFIGKQEQEKFDLLHDLPAPEETPVAGSETPEPEPLTDKPLQPEKPEQSAKPQEPPEKIRKEPARKTFFNWCWPWVLLAFLLGLILGCLLCSGGINPDWRGSDQSTGEPLDSDSVDTNDERSALDRLLDRRHETTPIPDSVDNTDEQSALDRRRETAPIPDSVDNTDAQSALDRRRETTPIPDSVDTTDEQSAFDKILENIRNWTSADSADELIAETPLAPLDNINEAVCEQFSQQQPVDDIMFVLDGSSSMNEPMESSNFLSKFIKSSRMKIAKKSLDTLMQGIPDETRVGMVAFRGCENLLISEPTPKINSNFMREIVAPLEAQGLTNLISSVTKAAELLTKHGSTGKKSIIMVLTDGEQSAECGGDLCQFAKNLHQKYPDIHINIIDMSGDGRASCLAKETNGLVFNPKDSDEILSMMEQSTGRKIPPQCLEFTPRKR